MAADGHRAVPDDQAETRARLALGAARGRLLDLLNRLLLKSAEAGGVGAT
jgi:hypothetical protein